MLVACVVRCAFRGAGGAGAGGGAKKGEVIHSNRGGPCTVSNGIASSKLRPSACRVNDATVVHRRRGDWSQLVSSALNIFVDISCPPERARCEYRHLRVQVCSRHEEA